MSLLAGIHHDKDKGPPPQPANFHPYLPDPELRLPTATPEFLESLGFKRKKAKK